MKQLLEFLVNKPITHIEKKYDVYRNVMYSANNVYYIKIYNVEDLDLLYKKNNIYIHSYNACKEDITNNSPKQIFIRPIITKAVKEDKLRWNISLEDDILDNYYKKTNYTIKINQFNSEYWKKMDWQYNK